MLKLKTKDFNYHLPQELIAQYPAENRDGSRLLVLDRKTGQIEHKVFSQIAGYLVPEDLLVLNNTKVMPARLNGQKYGGGAKIEVLLNKKIGADLWEALTRPSKRLEKGTVIEFANGFYGEVKEKLDDGKAIIYFACLKGFDKELDEHGNVPLPPYIKQNGQDPARYQTVYAENSGASAAPTAGLHFTKSLLDRISAKKTYVTLHTGYGTFAPVRAENVADHKMHSESYEVKEAAIRDISAAKAQKGRVIAVGTTSARLLESIDKSGKGETDIFIYPGYKFKAVDALITNFHLPMSTLFMMVSAFAGLDLIKIAYKEAIDRRYRFFSFGDAMLIK